MAIYHLTHRTVGRTTHAAGTAGAHLGYITRASACRAVIAEHIPLAKPGSKGGAARKWMDEAEAADRKNARVIDKFEIALPRELNEAQRIEVVRTFIRELADGKPVPFFAALHDKAGTKDAANPHAHVVIRDRDPETGKGRVINTSEKGSTERAREIWERVCNEALRDAGLYARVDRRSLVDQGILHRKPAGHEGPQPRAMESRQKPSEKLSRIRAARKGPRRVAEAAQRVSERKLQTRQMLPRESQRRYGSEYAALFVHRLDENARYIWKHVTQRQEAQKRLTMEAWAYLETRLLPDIVSDQIADIVTAFFRRPKKQPVPLNPPSTKVAVSQAQRPEPTVLRYPTSRGPGF